MADQRLDAVYRAASQLFIAKGYNNTQVSQIAEAAGVATGTMYNLFAGKKAILYFVVVCSLNKNYLDGEILLPIKEVDDAVILERLAEIVNDLFLNLRTPGLTFAEMLSLVFDYAASYNAGFALINDNRDVLGAVTKQYSSYVSQLDQLMEASLRRFIESGEIRNVEYPELHLRNIFEGTTWWSMYVPFKVPHIKLPVGKAKEIALDILTHAYVKR